MAAEVSVAEVRAELAKPDRANTADIEVIKRAESTFQRLVNKVWGWIKTGTVLLAGGIVAGVGKGIGEALWSDPHAFLEVLEEAGYTLSQWAGHLTSLL